jgi:hypothetical protein
MKKIFLLFILTNTLSFCFSQYNNYANGNGSVIETKNIGNVKLVFRKHIQRLRIGDLAKDINLNIYDQPIPRKGKVINKLKQNDYINITQVAETTFASEHYTFLNIRTDKNISGWILCGKYNNEFAQVDMPYYNNRWEIIKKINIHGRIWTIRKMVGQQVSVWGVLNIRDNPGLVDTKVISKIIPPKDQSPQVNLWVTEATEEEETIDGFTDRWLRINYNGVEGWIFGGYASVERGGPKYYTPENIIDFELGEY